MGWDADEEVEGGFVLLHLFGQTSFLGGEGGMQKGTPRKPVIGKFEYQWECFRTKGPASPAVPLLG